MNPDDRALLERVLELSEENHAMLAKMRRSAMWSAAFRVLYWVLIIGISVGAYVYVQPYLDLLAKQFDSVKSALGSLNGGGSGAAEIGQLVKNAPK